LKKIIGIIILLVAYQIVNAQTGHSCQDAIPLTNFKTMPVLIVLNIQMQHQAKTGRPGSSLLPIQLAFMLL